MSYTNTSIATVIVGVIGLGSGSMTISAQATVDVENRYSSVGAIMVWRVDDAGQAPQCDPTDEILVAPLEPGIADVGLVFLAYTPPGISAALVAEPGTLDRSEGAPTTIVGYGTTTPRDRTALPDPAMWDGMRRTRTSILRRVVDETWALWSIPSYVCSGDSGGAIFLNAIPGAANQEVLAANVSDGGLDCRRHNNNNRLDTLSVQQWISDALRRAA